MNMRFDRQARLTRIYQQLNRENSIGAVWQLNFQTAPLSAFGQPMVCREPSGITSQIFAPAAREAV